MTKTKVLRMTMMMKTTIGMTMQMTMTTLPRNRSQTASWCSLERSADWLRASTASTFIRWPITSKTVVIRCRSMIAFTMLKDVDIYAVQISLDVPTIDVLGNTCHWERKGVSQSQRERGGERRLTKKAAGKTVLMNKCRTSLIIVLGILTSSSEYHWNPRFTEWVFGKLLQGLRGSLQSEPKEPR